MVAIGERGVDGLAERARIVEELGCGRLEVRPARDVVLEFARLRTTRDKRGVLAGQEPEHAANAFERRAADEDAQGGETALVAVDDDQRIRGELAPLFEEQRAFGEHGRPVLAQPARQETALRAVLLVRQRRELLGLGNRPLPRGAPCVRRAGTRASRSSHVPRRRNRSCWSEP